MILVNPHTLVGPAIDTGVAGAWPTTVNVGPGTFPQAFTAETDIVPVIKVDPTVTVIELVAVPVAMVTPVGNVQAYDVAPNTGATL